MLPRKLLTWRLFLSLVALLSTRNSGFSGQKYLPRGSKSSRVLLKSIEQSGRIGHAVSIDEGFLKQLRTGSAALSLALCLWAAPPWAHALSSSPTPAPPSLFDDVLKIIAREFVPRNGASQPSPALLEEAAVNAALRALDDPYTSLVPLGRGASSLSSTIAAGKKSGTSTLGASDLGLAVVKDSKVQNALIVVGVDEGSPAEVADFRVGDRIVSYNVLAPSRSSKSAVDVQKEQKSEEIFVNALIPLAERAAQLREASSVSVERDGLGIGRQLRLETPIESRKPLMSQRSVTLAGALSSPSASTSVPAVLPIAYVRLDNFGPRAADEIVNALAAIAGSDGSSEGVESTVEALEPTIALSGVVLDLRHNPGGRLDAAVDVASLFLPENTPVATLFGGSAAPPPSIPSSSKVADSAAIADIKSKDVQLTAQGGALVAPSTKIVVLVDSATTSAAELVAASLQEADRAVLVGDHRTFGKAAAQESFDIPVAPTTGAQDVGLKRQLRITTARYETPVGRRLDGSRPSKDAIISSHSASRVTAADANSLVGSSSSGDHSNGQKSYYSAHGRPLYIPTSKEPGLTPDLWARYDGTLLPWASFDESPLTSATPTRSRYAPSMHSRSSQASLLEAEEEAAAADRALVASGAYFEWASDWCIRHPNLVALSATNHKAGAEALDAVLRGDRSDADLSSNTNGNGIGNGNNQENAGEAGSKRSTRGSSTRGSSSRLTRTVDSNGGAVVNENEAREAAVIYEDFRRYLLPRGVLPWARSPLLEALATAKNSFNCDIPPSSACSSGSSSGGGPAARATERAVKQAESTAAAALQSALDTPSGRALASSRCEAAIRARFLTAGEVRRQTTAHDPMVRAATNLLATNSGTNESSEGRLGSKQSNRNQRRGTGNTLSSATDMYAKALEVPALSNEAGDDQTPPKSTRSSDESVDSGAVPGYEPLGQCLPLQTCNEREFVYLSLT